MPQRRTFIYRRQRRKGFSLIECAFSTFLVAVVIVAALKSVAATQRMRMSIPQQRADLDLAQRLLTEVVQARYLDPGTSPVFGPEVADITGNRSLFNDVDDYHLWSESPPTAKDGTQLTALTGWSRQVRVDWVDPANPATSTSTDLGLKKITVTVTSPKAKATTLTALRASRGLGERKESTATTYVTWAGVDISVGPSLTMSTGVNLANGAK
jgi:hypothetical protein